MDSNRKHLTKHIWITPEEWHGTINGLLLRSITRNGTTKGLASRSKSPEMIHVYICVGRLRLWQRQNVQMMETVQYFGFFPIYWTINCQMASSSWQILTTTVLRASVNFVSPLTSHFNLLYLPIKEIWKITLKPSGMVSHIALIHVDFG